MAEGSTGDMSSLVIFKICPSCKLGGVLHGHFYDANDRILEDPALGRYWITSMERAFGIMVSWYLAHDPRLQSQLALDRLFTGIRTSGLPLADPR